LTFEFYHDIITTRQFTLAFPGKMWNSFLFLPPSAGEKQKWVAIIGGIAVGLEKRENNG
jgi:hypothetical protein